MSTSNKTMPFTGGFYGLVGGIVIIIATILMYIINTDWLTNFSSAIVLQLVLIGFMVVASNEARKQNLGYIDFAGALKNAFGVAALAMLISTIFYFILYKYIDPSLVIQLKKKSIQGMTEYMQKQGKTAKDIEESVKTADEQDYNPQIKYSSLIYAWYLFVSFFYALIIAAIFHFAYKHKQPVGLIDTNE